MADSTSVTTSMLHTGRPAKRARANDAASQQASQLEALFKNPDKTLEVAVGPQARVLAAPPELVTNVQGSSAGAGSGEFHVYKASRRREYERLRAMDEEVANEKADKEWEEQRKALKRKEDAKISKNRARREKQKARQGKSQDGPATESRGADGKKGETIPNVTKKPAVVKAPSTITTNGPSKADEAGTAAVSVDEGGLTFLEDD